MGALSFLEDRQRVFIRQQKEWTEILVGWETRNQYAVQGEGGEPLGRIVERSGGLVDHLKRFVLRSHRPFEIAVFDGGKTPTLELSRSFFFLFSALEIRGPDGAVVGGVHRRFGILNRRYDLRDARGRVFARVVGPLWRIWTFRVLADGGGREAVITKKWGGLLREAFADADTFGVDFGNADWQPAERAVIFAAAISIDLDFFENNQARGGLLD